MAKRKLKDALRGMPSTPNQGFGATFRTRPPRATSSVSPTGGQAPKPQPVTTGRTPKPALKSVRLDPSEMRVGKKNTTTNPRAGKKYDEVTRGAREFHVYYGDGKREVFEVHKPTVSGKKPQKTTPGFETRKAQNGALGQPSAMGAASAATRRLNAARRGASNQGALSAAARKAMSQQPVPRSGAVAARNRRRRTSSLR